MESLLTAYSIEEILLFISILVGAVISIIKTFDFLKDKLYELVEKKIHREDRLTEMNNNIALLLEKSNERDRQIQILMDSDKSRIRAEITREWEKRRYEEKIDPLTLQYLQSQYLCYKSEGGNSYISSLMDEIYKWEPEAGEYFQHQKILDKTQ